MSGPVVAVRQTWGMPRRGHHARSSRILPDRVDGERLTLRTWRHEDVAAIAGVVARNLDHLRPWMGWIADEPLADATRAAQVARWEEGRLAGGDAVYGIWLDDAVVGGSGLHRRRGPTGVEIGYWVDKDHVGRGIATETAALLTATALGMRGITFVEIHHDKANTRSRRVPERLGFVLVGEEVRAPRAPAEMGIDCAWRTTVVPSFDVDLDRDLPGAGAGAGGAPR